MSLAAEHWGEEDLSTVASQERAELFLREVLTCGETRDDAGNTPRGGQTPDGDRTPPPVASPRTPPPRLSPQTPVDAQPQTPAGTILVSISSSPEPERRRAPEPKKRSRSNKIDRGGAHFRLRI